jgi:hypothetical protein
MKPFIIAVLAVTALVAITVPTLGVAQGAATAPWPTDEFCGRAQGYVTLASRPARNVLHEGYDSFRGSAASVQPLEAQQYTVADPATGQVRLISCKLATVDKRGTLHLISRSWTGNEAGRGVRHCHFIAPDFARRILLDGSLALPATPVKR